MNKIAFFMDAPNIMRTEFKIDLDRIKKILDSYGNVQVSKVFLNQFAGAKLIEAITNLGFEVVMGMGKTKDDSCDVDIYMSVEIMDSLYNNDIDVFVISTRDSDFVPIINKIKARGKYIVLLAPEFGLSKALRNSVHEIRVLGPEKDVTIKAGAMV